MDYSVISHNQTGNINLHDCICSKIEYLDGRLVFDMEWVEVLATHPENPYDKAHQSGEARIEFTGLTFDKAQIYPIFSPNNGSDARDLTPEEIHFTELTVLDFDEKQSDEGYTVTLFAEFDESKEHDFLSLQLRFTDSYLMWNTLGEESWFEQWHH